MRVPARNASRNGRAHLPTLPTSSYFTDNVVNNGSICVLLERLVGFFAKLPESVS